MNQRTMLLAAILMSLATTAIAKETPTVAPTPQPETFLSCKVTNPTQKSKQYVLDCTPDKSTKYKCSAKNGKGGSITIICK